jgi:acyl transferase domain-containing protein
MVFRQRILQYITAKRNQWTLSALLLHIAQAAMEDAGYAEDTTPTFKRHLLAAILGVATGDYTDNLRNNIDVYYSPGKRFILHNSERH